VSFQRADVLLTAIESFMGGGRGPEWFEALADSADEAQAQFNRQQQLRNTDPQINTSDLQPGMVVHR
jgi:hypothetical protein